MMQARLRAAVGRVPLCRVILRNNVHLYVQTRRLLVSHTLRAIEMWKRGGGPRVSIATPFFCLCSVVPKDSF